MKRVLVATDDFHVGQQVSGWLGAFDVALERCAPADAPRKVADSEPDLLVLDVSVDPDAGARAFERALPAGAPTRLLLLVDPDSAGSVQLPVRSPADFFVKGASSGEFSARIRALLWPGEEACGRDIVRIGDLVLNLATYQALLGGVPIDFTYLEYALFSFLVTHPRRTYSREVLLRRVWGCDYFGGTRTVDVHVRRIRAKIGPELSRHLETVRNVGYLWTE